MNRTDRQWFALGKLGKPKGLKGEMFFDAYNPDSDTLARVSNVRVETHEFHVAEFHAASTRPIVRFEEVSSVDQAKPLTGLELFVRRTDLPVLPKGQHFVGDLVGFEVKSRDNKKTLGVLKSVIPTVSNDIYVVQGEEEILLPIIEGVIEKIDTDAQIIWVNPPEVVDAI